MAGWIGVDLDGTLVRHGPGDWKGPLHVGEPIPEMVQRVRAWLAAGLEVRILTARVSDSNPRSLVEGTCKVAKSIQDWSEFHIGQRLTVTCTKDYDMIELWDDRAVAVEKNTGRRLSPSAVEKG